MQNKSDLYKNFNNTSDISVIVQGAVSDRYTNKVLKSIRKYLPKSEIILSTWENSNVQGLDYDILVESSDPGAEMLFPQWNQKHNLNRQIVSTKNGIKRASRKYVLKIRTDVSLKSNDFLKYFDKYDKRCETCKILEKRVIICNYYARKPEIFPYHISDWVFFGLKQDVENIWDIPLAPEPETTKWFYSHELKEQHLNNGVYSHFRHRYCAEQYIWYSFLKKYIDINFDDMFDITARNIEYTKISFANNLVIISPNEFGINFLKQNLNYETDIYNFYRWLKLYKIYCDPNIKIGNIHEFQDDEKFIKRKKKFFKHFIKFITPLKIMTNYVLNIFSCLYYIFDMLIQALKVLIFGSKDSCYKDYKYLKSLIKKLPISKKIKRVNILNMAIGETFIIANLMEKIDKIYPPEETVWVTIRESTKMIMDAYYPDRVKYINLKKHFFSFFNYEINEWQFNIFLDDDFWFNLWSKKEHFLSSLAKKLNIKETDLQIKTPEFKNIDEFALMKKIQNTGLNIDNFVFICPEANSMIGLSTDFWEKTVKILQKNKYDVFANITSSSNISGAKSCPLNLGEAFYLATKAKKIIGLRSGFMELFLSNKIPMFVIYNLKYNNKNSYLINLYDNYNLDNYPKNPDLMIKEYIMDDKDIYDELARFITGNLHEN